MIRLFAVALAAAALAFADQPARAADKPWPNARFSVEVRGSGPDVILIPGLASARAVWTETAARLEKTHRVHLVQVAGFAGDPAVAGDGPVFAPLVEDLDRYVREKDLKSPAVIGHSMGGAAGLALAARHPGSVDRLLIVDSLPFYSLIFSPQATATLVQPQAEAFRNGLIAAADGQFAAMQKAAMAGLTKTEAGRAQGLAWSLASDRRAVAQSVYDLMTTDLRPELGRVTARTTVLYAWDASIGVPAERFDALFQGAYAGAPVTLRRIDGSYHFIMWDQPAAFAAEVDAFLK